jgi:hypothetical protein
MPKPAPKQSRKMTVTKETVGSEQMEDVVGSQDVSSQEVARSIQALLEEDISSEDVGSQDPAQEDAQEGTEGSTARRRGPMFRWSPSQLKALWRLNKAAGGSKTAVELRTDLINDPAFDGVDPELVTATKVSQQVNRMRSVFAPDERDKEAPKLKRAPMPEGSRVGRKVALTRDLFLESENEEE